MDEHTCESCHPTVTALDRISEGHLSVRFGDHPFRAYYNGIDVTHGITEALAGEAGTGWVVAIGYYPGSLEVERCPVAVEWEAALYVVHGQVRVHKVGSRRLRSVG